MYISLVVHYWPASVCVWRLLTTGQFTVPRPLGPSYLACYVGLTCLCLWLGPPWFTLHSVLHMGLRGFPRSWCLILPAAEVCGHCACCRVPNGCARPAIPASLPDWLWSTRHAQWACMEAQGRLVSRGLFRQSVVSPLGGEGL